MSTLDIAQCLSWSPDVGNDLLLFWIPLNQCEEQCNCQHRCKEGIFTWTDRFVCSSFIVNLPLAESSASPAGKTYVGPRGHLGLMLALRRAQFHPKHFHPMVETPNPLFSPHTMTLMEREESTRRDNTFQVFSAPTVLCGPFCIPLYSWSPSALRQAKAPLGKVRVPYLACAFP